MSCGIIVGSDRNQQELLPFWWVNYRLHNNTPVTFFDFGMDIEFVDWCKARGQVIALHNFENENKRGENPNLHPRKSWFLKPLALNESPYDKTIWIDADCLIRCSLYPLFEYELNDLKIALVQEPKVAIEGSIQHGFIPQGSIMHNTGVVLIHKGSPILLPWIEACKKENNYRGDQEALTHVFFNMQKKPTSIPDKFNWTVIGHRSLNASSHILHMTGPMLKIRLKIAKDICLSAINQTF